MPDAFVTSPLAGLDALAAEWDALAERVEAPPFLRPGWFAAFSRAFGAPVEVLAVRRAGALVGVLPVRRRPGSLVAPTNWHTPAFGVVADGAEAMRAVAAAAITQAGPRLDVGFLTPDDPFCGELRDAARQAGRRLLTRVQISSPELVLEGDFESYEQTRPAKMRREIRRRRRRLGDDHGEVEVSFSDGRDDLDRLLDEGFGIEGSGWKTEQGTAIAQDPATDRFYREVARWAAQRGWLQLGFVRVAGRPVAFAFSFVQGGVVSVLKIGYHPDFARYAVGTLLTREAICRAYDQGMRRYDFLGGADPYKLEWTDRLSDRVRVQAFEHSALGAGQFVLWRHGRPAAQRALRYARPLADRVRG